MENVGNYILHFKTITLFSHILCLTSYISYLISHISYLLSYFLYLTSPISPLILQSLPDFHIIRIG